jgi:hypothetical protein
MGIDINEVVVRFQDVVAIFQCAQSFKEPALYIPIPTDIVTQSRISGSYAKIPGEFFLQMNRALLMQAKEGFAKFVHVCESYYRFDSFITDANDVKNVFGVEVQASKKEAL